VSGGEEARQQLNRVCLSLPAVSVFSLSLFFLPIKLTRCPVLM